MRSLPISRAQSLPQSMVNILNAQVAPKIMPQRNFIDENAKKAHKAPAPVVIFPKINGPTTKPNPKDLINLLTDDKLNALLLLFDAQIDKPRPEKINMFLNDIYPHFVERAPKLDGFLLNFIEQLSSNNEMAQLIRNPPIPNCLQHSNVRPTVIKPVQFCKDGFDVESPLRIGKNEVVAVGMLFCPMNGGMPRTSIRANNKDVFPCTYGEPGQQYYMLHQFKKASKPVHVVFPPAFENYLAFFIVQYCFKRPTENVAKEALRLSKITLDSDCKINEVYVKSLKCSCKASKLIDIIEEMMRTGICKCPTCNTDLTFKDFVLDQKKKDPTKEEKAQEVMQARQTMSNSLCLLMKSKNDESSLSSIIFDSAPKDIGSDTWEPEQNPMNDGVEAYLKSYEDLLNN